MAEMAEMAVEFFRQELSNCGNNKRNPMKRLLQWFIAVSLTGLLAQAQGPDEQYLRIYSLIQEGDRLNASGESGTARAKYVEADGALKKLQAGYPNWNEKVVRFRIRYIEERIGALPTPAQPVRTPEKAAEKKRPPAIDERDTQIRSLQEAIQRLESDKAVLQAKLKEALTAQPSTLDPRELARAEQRIRAVEKEKDLLRVALDQEKVHRATLIEPSTVDSIKTRLAEANRKLAEQNEAALALVREKQVLEGRLRELPSDQSMQALRSENEALKKQLSAKGESVRRRNDLEKQLAEARAAVQSSAKTIARLQEDQSALEKTKRDLEKRLAAANASASTSDTAASERIRRLERERDDLQTRLKQASQSSKSQNRRDASEKELASVKARLASLEAQKVPYSAEELALFKQPPLQPSKVVAKTAKNTAKELPVNTVTLVAEAESAFRSRRYSDAERKYQEVLKFDESNSSTLANLAASQLEQNKVEDAEITLKRALAAEPDDSHALTLLGIVKFRQEKFDDAFDALSRSAQMDPQNAEAQNYLGITLSQKGQRGAAETALRKAIQLSPGYGSAHNNLAVIYATQQPPFLELARWHYQKALAAGHPQNIELEKLLDRKAAVEGK